MKRLISFQNGKELTFATKAISLYHYLSFAFSLSLSLSFSLFLTLSLSFSLTLSNFSDPLHPQNPAEIRSVIRRELTTISTFGKAVANLFDVVDDVVLAYVDMAINALNQQAAG